MAFSTYTELKAAITDWMDRSDVSGSAADFVTLAEAEFNREIEVVETDVTLSGVAGSAVVDVSAYSIIEPMSLFATVNGDDEEIEFRAPGSFPYSDDQGLPGFVALNGTNLKFSQPLDQSYVLRFRYRGRFALSDAAETNDLLTNHPDLYLAACIAWGGVYTVDSEKIASHLALVERLMPGVKSHYAQRKRGVITPSPELRQMVG